MNRSNRAPRGRKRNAPLLTRWLLQDRQSCPVAFFEETLLLLAECSMGSASEVEKACQKLIPIRHVAALLTESWCVPAVKIAALTFLREAHYDVADPASRQAACVDPSTWKIIKYLRETLVKVVARVPETFCDLSLYGPLPKMVEEALVMQALRLFTVFLQKCYRSKLVGEADAEELSLLVDILIRMMSEGVRGWVARGSGECWGHGCNGLGLQRAPVRVWGLGLG